MDFASKTRAADIILFHRALSGSMSAYKKRKRNKETSVFDTLEKKYLTSGVEGAVFKAQPKANFEFEKAFIIKLIDFVKIRDSKEIQLDLDNTTSDSFYQLYIDEKSFSNPTFIELISATLVNQLVTQKICPHFVLNYSWEYNQEKQALITYNEFADIGDFDAWTAKTRPEKYWFNAFFQILVGLLALQRYFGMIHCDFHSGNILVKSVAPGGYWTYYIDNVKYRLPNLGFVFLINDFGFSWIPSKMCVPWLYNDKLQFVTTFGKKLYDIETFIQSIKSIKNVPKSFLDVLNKVFPKSDLQLILRKDYYIDLYRSRKKPLPKYLLSHNNSDVNTPVTLTHILYKMFYNNSDHSFNYASESAEPDTFKIESYNLNLKLDPSNLPSTFHSLLRTEV